MTCLRQVISYLTAVSLILREIRGLANSRISPVRNRLTKGKGKSWIRTTNTPVCAKCATFKNMVGHFIFSFHKRELKPEAPVDHNDREHSPDTCYRADSVLLPFLRRERFLPACASRCWVHMTFHSTEKKKRKTRIKVRSKKNVRPLCSAFCTQQKHSGTFARYETHHDVVSLHLRFLTGQFLTLQFQTVRGEGRENVFQDRIHNNRQSSINQSINQSRSIHVRWNNFTKYDWNIKPEPCRTLSLFVSTWCYFKFAFLNLSATEKEALHESHRFSLHTQTLTQQVQ